MIFQLGIDRAFVLTDQKFILVTLTLCMVVNVNTALPCSNLDYLMLWFNRLTSWPGSLMPWRQEIVCKCAYYRFLAMKNLCYDNAY